MITAINIFRNTGFLVLKIFVATLIICTMFSSYSSAKQPSKNFNNIELPKNLNQSNSAIWVEGKIAKTNPVYLDLKTIQQFPSVEITIMDPWDKKQRQYEGIYVIDLLNFLEVNPQASRIEIVARNDYKSIISIEDLKKYKHILSYKMDQTYYKLLPDKENKGPLAIAIDFNSFKDLNVDIYKQQMVWWIQKIIVK